MQTDICCLRRTLPVQGTESIGMAGASTVAWLQRAGVLVWVATVGSIPLVFAPDMPIAAWWAVCVCAFLPAGVIALEMACAAGVENAAVHSERTAPQTWVAVWWREMLFAARVFAWRQPFGWRLLPDTAASRSDLSPVVFVHGYLCNRAFWQPWMVQCRAIGRPYVTVNLEPIFGSIDGYAAQIEAAVQMAEAASGRRPFLVGHSMGGLAIRAWRVMQAKPSHEILGVVTLGSPHLGAWLARWSGTPNGRQMRIGSDWLHRLSAREASRFGASAHHHFLCWASRTDNVVFPVATAFLQGADNRILEAAGHIELAYRADVISTSLAWMASAERSPAARAAS